MKNTSSFLSIVTISRTLDFNLILTLQSIASQTRAPLELILVISDANIIINTENRILLEYEFLIDSLNTKVVLGKDKSLYNAMNIGLSKLETSHVLFLNSGDSFSSPSSIDLIESSIKEEPDKCHAFSVLQRDGNHVWVRFPWATRYPPHQGFVAVVDKTLTFPEKYPISADVEWIKLLISKHEMIEHLFPIAFFDLGGISNTLNLNTVKIRNKEKKFFKFLANIFRPRGIFRRFSYFTKGYYYLYKFPGPKRKV